MKKLKLSVETGQVQFVPYNLVIIQTWTIKTCLRVKSDALLTQSLMTSQLENKNF